MHCTIEMARTSTFAARPARS